MFFLNAMFSVISPEKMFDGHINCTGFDDDLKAFALVSDHRPNLFDLYVFRPSL